MIKFNNKDEQILGKAIKDIGINIKKGEIYLLKPINNIFHHPESTYVSSINPSKFLGRYSLQHFDYVRHISENENLSDIETGNNAEQLVLF